MNPLDYKYISNKVKEEFLHILNEDCYTNFKKIDISSANGQVFVLNLFYTSTYYNKAGEEIDDNTVVRPILYFQPEGIWGNQKLDINEFFNINDEIFDEFYKLGKMKKLNSLVPILKEGNRLKESRFDERVEVVSSLFLSLDSVVISDSQFLRKVLNEGITTFELNEDLDNIEVGCLMNERKFITANIDNKSIELKIPFDIVDKFQIFHQSNDSIGADEKLIFVAMSFQNDPSLEDAYESIKRAVKSIRKGLKSERVDEIEGDFTINDKIIESIKKCNIMIVDLTHQRPNVYYELGYGRALGKKIILLAREGEKPHFDVSNQNIIFYKNATSLEKSLKTRLQALLK
ncbi:nucleoside 2-deoxyribosyltransferase [Peribacillus frigoritolerans]|uniref:nucleoside 2-deoxyribosyltransferase n=1 Tax=Peribacillus frigoritolerans TaxID=450367 RepID=UPI00207A4396|nr:nucleoside 2-deoxyribosyltransferase [Peribacillus frigoritolerans]USK82640.1 nucleoside 2-deoxyribosyltransferase [Peribacillus frigoritolerans]